jgi:GNAT superfamily N-acetyltransferase
MRIRPAEPADAALIFSLVVELAEYERAPEQVTGTPELLADALFGRRPSAEALIAEQLDDAGAGLSGSRMTRARPDQARQDAERAASSSGRRAAGKPARQPVGFALFHGSFSTWECRPGIWLEDLYVPPRHRRAGIGRALLSEVASIAVARGCARLEWAALDWNTPALEFYERLSSQRLHQWVMHRLDGPALERVAAEARAQNGGHGQP